MLYHPRPTWRNRRKIFRRSVQWFPYQKERYDLPDHRTWIWSIGSRVSRNLQGWMGRHHLCQLKLKSMYHITDVSHYRHWKLKVKSGRDLRGKFYHCRLFKLNQSCRINAMRSRVTTFVTHQDKFLAFYILWMDKLHAWKLWPSIR